MTQGPVPVYHPAPPRPPLTPRARRGAWIAGAVSFSVLSLGWTLLSGAVMVALVGGMILGIAQLIGRGGAGEAGFREFLGSFDLGQVGIWLVVGGVVGLALMAAALFVSRGILGAHGVNQPWGVTWAGTGIAVVGSWLIGTVGGFVVQVASWLTSDVDLSGFAVAAAAILIPIAVLGTAAIGWFSWWWMAHVLRPRDIPSTSDTVAP